MKTWQIALLLIFVTLTGLSIAAGCIDGKDGQDAGFDNLVQWDQEVHVLQST